MGVTSPLYLIAEKLTQFQTISTNCESRVPVAASDETTTFIALGLPAPENSHEN